MRTYIKLPTEKDKLAKVISEHAAREETAATYRRLMWWLAYAYVALGVREFEAFDPLTGALRWSYLAKDGSISFQSQQLLSRISKNVGRIEAMDISPHVMKDGWTLEAIRERAISQAIADSVINTQHLRAVQKQYALMLTMLGFAGVSGAVVDHPTIGIIGDLEVVHPRELFPFPSLGSDYTKQAGLMRQRMVPLDVVLERLKKKEFSPERLAKMAVFARQPGAQMQEESHPTTGYPEIIYQDGNASQAETPENKVLQVRELWTWGPREMVDRYVMASGDEILVDEDLSDQEVYCPIGVGRFIENGTFYGAGVFDLLFSLHREMERMMKSLFNNVRDIDKYGIVVLPNGQFHKESMLRDIGRGLRALFWEPDGLAEGFTPFTITPHNAGDVPGKTAQFAFEQLSVVDPLRDLIEEKGRVDSALGLQILDEKINQGMTNASTAVQTTFGTVYREVTRRAAEMMVQSDRAIPINRLTLDLVGVVIDVEEGTATFAENPLPNVSRLHFGVKEINPKSKVARKQEALMLAEKQLIDPQRLMMLNLEENLDLATWDAPERAARETVTQDLILVYGDGVTPGEVLIAPYTVNPTIQLPIVMAFLAGPQVRRASPQVKEALMNYRDGLLEFSGMTLPNAVPLIEDLATFGQLPAGPPQGESQPPSPQGEER